MKNALFLILLVCSGCRGIFWNEKLKLEATDYAVGQKYELVSDTWLAPDGFTAPFNHRVNRDFQAISQGTQLRVCKIEFVNNVELGRTIRVFAEVLSDVHKGRTIRLFGISLHQRPGDTNIFPDSLSHSFADPKILKKL